MQDANITKTAAIETSEEVRSTFAVQKNHLWYAFASDLIPGATKIGDTTRDVPTRVEEWRADFPDARILGNGSLEVIPGTFVRDHALHKGCRLLGYRQLQAEDFADGIQHTTEAYDVTPEHAMEVIDEVIEDIVLSHDDPETPYTYYSVEDDKKEIGIAHYARDAFDWDLRPMQKEAVDNIDDAVAMGIDTMLLDASVRFGKCFTTLAAAQRLGYRRVLVTSGKADVEGEWKKAVEKPGQFAGWSFVSPDMLRASDDIISKVAEESDVVVAFMTLQDSYDAAEKRRYDQVFGQDWDLLVVDETHFGARAEEYGKAIDRVRRRATLHLSGSPFRILMTDEFSDDQIVACKTRADMVAERDAWDKEHGDEIAAGTLKKSANPYFGIPTPVTFALQGDAATLAKIGTLKEDGITIDLAELLATDHDAENPSFKHEESVRALLSMIDGEDSTFGFLRYDVAEANDLFQHMVMCLPEKDSCDAMADLLANMAEEGTLDRLGKYEVINIAGNHAPKEYGAAGGTQAVVRDIATLAAKPRKTVSLTVYRMLTGVTVPEWDSMLMLSGMSSAETYEQATGRLMSPFVQTTVNEKDSADRDKVNRKSHVVVVDFDPARVFKMAEQRSIAQRLTGKGIDEAVEHEMRYAPIITANPDGFMRVTPTDLRREISRYATNGITEEVARIPVDDGMFNDWDFITALKDFDGNGVGAKREIEVDPFEESGAELDIDIPEDDGADALEDVDSEETADADDHEVVDWGDADEKALDEARKAFAAKVRDFYFRSVAFAAAWHLGAIKTLDDIRIRAKTTKTGRTIATNLGILDDIDVLCAAVSRFKNVQLQLDNAIYNISTLVNDPELTGMEKAEILMQRFGRLSSSEVATPLWVARKMVGAIPETAFEKDTPRFLDLASKTGEMAYALVERCATMGKVPEVRSVPTGSISYVLTVACYRLLGLEPRQVAKFTSYDLIGKDTDVETMAKTLRQDKDFYQIDLFDMLGGNADEKTDEVEEQPVDRTDDGTTGETGLLEFDAVVSNPPYQISDGGARASAKPVYPEFVNLASEISKCISIIMPARWFAGGKGLDKFRNQMLNDCHIRGLYDFPNPEDCFPGINLRGGVCFFVRDESYNNAKDDVRVVTYIGHTVQSDIRRQLKTAGSEIFIRESTTLTILDKINIIHNNEKRMNTQVSAAKAFGFRTFFITDARFHNSSNGLIEPIICYGRSGKVGYVERSEITSHTEWIDQWKVFVPEAHNIGTELHDDNLNVFIGSPGTISTETFLVIGAELGLDKDSAQNLCSYLKTKFSRYLISVAKTSQHGTSKTYCFVPLQDFTSGSNIDWSKSIDEIDEQLFDKYDLDEIEREFIKTHVQRMD